MEEIKTATQAAPTATKTEEKELQIPEMKQCHVVVNHHVDTSVIFSVDDYQCGIFNTE